MFTTKHSIVVMEYLIRRVADTDIEVRPLHFAHIPQQHLQPLRLGLALHSLRHLGRHARVQLHGDHFLCLLEDLDRQVARPGADFQHDVALLDVGFVDDGLGHARVLEHVLPDVGLHLEDCILSGGGRCAGVWA